MCYIALNVILTKLKGKKRRSTPDTSQDAKFASGRCVQKNTLSFLYDVACGALHGVITSLATPLQKSWHQSCTQKLVVVCFATTLLVYPYTGSPSVTDLTFNGQSRTLTCTSTGGPATIVTWRKDGAAITLNATYQHKQIVTNTTTSTYQTVLTIDPSVVIVGAYNCTVENARGRSSRIVVIGETWLNSYTLIYILNTIVCWCT